MRDAMLEPVKFWPEAERNHKENVEEYFQNLLEDSAVDVEANRETVRKYKQQEEVIAGIDKKIKRFKLIRVLLIVAAVIGAILFFISFGNFNGGDIGNGLLNLFIGIVLAGGSLTLLFLKINPIIKDASALREKEAAKAEELMAQAYAQVAPLNALFDNTDTFRIMEATLPELTFENSYTKKHEELLIKQHNFVDMGSSDTSVVDTIAGTFCGNPFLYYRHKVHVLGEQRYDGTLTISWTETYLDSNGKMATRTKTQTLTASVFKPKPFYHYATSLGYGCQAAPDLSFSRKAQHSERLSDREVDKKVRSGEKELRKLAKKALKENGTFQEMADSEFDVLFGAVDRDNEVQFRVMYTPLGQRNTVSLLRHKEGYGDDFEFYKMKRYNVIQSEHAQQWKMDTATSNYISYDVDEIHRKFADFNNTYFKSVYFDFAPLMCVPAYQDPPAYSMEPLEYYDSYCTSYEHEVLANAIGQGSFAHELSETEAILKTVMVKKDKEGDVVDVTALSYSTEERMDYVPVLGGDGKTHMVPVPWVEYMPLSKTTQIKARDMALSERDFREKIDYSQSAPWAYVHGIYGKIID